MNTIDLAKLLSVFDRPASRRLGLFALLVEWLANRALNAAEATRLFFNAENCLYVQKKLRDKTADKIMSHGLQLQDLFEALPGKEAQQEFQRELEAIRSLCLQLLNRHKLVA
jgi:hypothetical protein